MKKIYQRVKKICKICQKEFEISEGRLKGIPTRGKYCSLNCYAKARSINPFYWKKGIEKMWKIRKENEDFCGDKSPNWKGGRFKTSTNYIVIWIKNHPFADRKHYVREHRLIMEKYLRKTNPNHPALIEINGEKYLNIKWIVHHKNGRRDDNRIENLELYYKNKHPIGQNICPKCGYKF